MGLLPLFFGPPFPPQVLPLKMYNRHYQVVNPYFRDPIQLGGSIPLNENVFYTGIRRQRGGSVFSSLFSSLARNFLPFAKQYVLPNIKSTAKSVLSDVLEGENLKQSIKKRGVSSLKTMRRDYLAQSGSGRRRRTRQKRSPRKTKRSRASVTKKRKRRVVRRKKKKNLGFKQSIFD